MVQAVRLNNRNGIHDYFKAEIAIAEHIYLLLLEGIK